jgi:hypothetical protein
VRLRPPAVALLALAASALRAAAQEPSAFPTGVEQVVVHAVVRDGRGRIVRGLTRDDFLLAVRLREK